MRVRLEGRANSLEGRAGTLETRAGQMEDQEKQTQGMVGQVKTTADQATQGVTDVNKRVSDIDNYDVKDSATVYFRLNSATLSDDGKRDLDDIAKKALAQKGYMIEIAGFADKTGNVAVNQALSERRAHAVIQLPAAGRQYSDSSHPGPGRYGHVARSGRQQDGRRPQNESARGSEDPGE